MAQTYKILGQVRPSGTTVADLYEAANETIVSTLTITNTSNVPAAASVFVRKFNTTLPAASEANALIFETYIDPNDFSAVTIGLTLSPDDVVSVKSSTGNALTFQLFGSEII